MMDAAGYATIDEALLAEIAGSPAVAIDTETSGLLFDDVIIGISVAWRGNAGEIGSVYLNLGHPPSLFFPRHSIQDAARILSAVRLSPRVFMFNATFDLERLARWDLIGTGIDWLSAAQLIDVQAASRICLPYARKEGASLLNVIEKLLQDRPKELAGMKKARADLHTIPAELVEAYARADAEYTLRAGEKIVERALAVYGPDEGLRLLERESRFIALLTRVQMRGLVLNQAWIQEKITSVSGRIDGLETRELPAHGITDPGNRRHLIEKLGIDVERLPRTEHGAPSLDNKALATMGIQSARLVLEWRQLNKARSTWLEGYLDMVAADGRVHPRFNAAGTISGRLSCTSPNLQAVPLSDRGRAFGSLAGMFAASPGHQVWAGDLSQAELRLASLYAKCNKMAAIFADGKDVHAATAAEMWPDREITKTLRQLGKGANYTLIYGGGVRALAHSCGLSESESEEIIGRHRAALPELTGMLRTATRKWESEGCVKLWTGRRRWRGDGEKPFAAFNQVVQGGVAEIVKDAMLSMESKFGHEAHILLQIHDSVEVEIQEGPCLEEAKRTLADCLQGALPDELRSRTDPPIPLLVDLERWA